MESRIARLVRLAKHVRVATLALALGTLGVTVFQVNAQAPPDAAQPSTPKLGLSINDPKAFPGYTLLAGLTSTKTCLIDMQGRVVRTWESNCTPGSGAYLLENGHLLRPGALGEEAQAFGGGPGAGGRIQEFTWDGELVWDFKFFNDKQLPHHDVIKLPNGNVLMIVWDRKTAKEALAAGRRPELVGASYGLPDALIEVKPTGKTAGAVVWEWHLWDHLVQDHDKSKANYGNVADHPELVNINYGEDVLAAIAATPGGADKLKSIGYVGSNTKKRVNPEWSHFNGLDYNPELDQIMVSVHSYSEIWIIDHSTTTAEAAGHSGGRGGKGGDLLYRWGNPQAYRAGTKAEQQLFAQHNAHWIPRGLPGAGHLLVFNNGGGRPDGSYSSVDELVLPPVDAAGRYARSSGATYGPDKPIWSYSAPKKSDFFSILLSGAQRLPNGNTLICSGVNGTLFEVTPEKEIVWKYLNPIPAGPGGGRPGFSPPAGAAGGGGGPARFGGGPPKPGQILPSMLQGMLRLTDQQKKELDGFQKEIDGKLDQLLTDAQNKQLKDLSGPGAFKGLLQPGQIMSPTLQARLKLTADQKKQVAALQKEADGKLDKLLADDQKKQLKGLKERFGRGDPGGSGSPGGPGGPLGFGPSGGSSVFRAYRYAVNCPGLVGKELTPGKTVEDLQPKPPTGK
jgi:hypothetical protein